jgi:hypothetical protein
LLALNLKSPMISSIRTDLTRLTQAHDAILKQRRATQPCPDTLSWSTLVHLPPLDRPYSVISSSRSQFQNFFGLAWRVLYFFRIQHINPTSLDLERSTASSYATAMLAASAQPPKDLALLWLIKSLTNKRQPCHKPTFQGVKSRRGHT